MSEKFYVRITNEACYYNKSGLCTNVGHPDYVGLCHFPCSFDKCPLNGKCKPLSNEEKEIMKEVHKIEMEGLQLISDRFRGLNRR